MLTPGKEVDSRRLDRVAKMAREEQDSAADKLMSGVGLAERTVKCVPEDSVANSKIPYWFKRVRFS